MMKYILALALILLPVGLSAQPLRREVTIGGRQTYAPSADPRVFGPIDVPIGTTLITATFDTSNHTSQAVVWMLNTQISRDGGSTWTTFVNIGRRLGGRPYSGKPASFSREINPPADGNTKLRGSYVISGGPLNTEIKVTLE